MSGSNDHPVGAATPARRNATTCSRTTQTLGMVVPTGRENAIHLETLSSFLGCSPSAVKRWVKAARLNGVPIMSGAAGYWKAASASEVQQFVAEMRSQALSRLTVAGRIKVDGKAE